MAEIKIFDASGKQTGSEAVSEKLANSNAKVTLIHQVAVAELAGKRQGTASTKTRGEVSGSTAKIRRQKGTGRSRQGDKRTPHMRGGGVVHGPKPRDYSQSTPRKMRQAAFRTVLNSRFQNDRIFIVEAAFAEAKTKDFVALLSQMGLSDYKLLFLTTAEDAKAALSARNLPKVSVQSVGQTSLTDVLKCDAILCTRTAWDEMAARVEGKSTTTQQDNQQEVVA